MNKKNWLLAIFFFSFTGISFIVYNPSALYFLNDDLLHIPLNKIPFFLQPHSFRVMHEILLTLEYHLFGKQPAGYHYIQFLVHLLCTVLVYFFSIDLCKQYGNLKEQENVLMSVLSASLFSVYAFHSEATLWILGTTASLAALFFLLSTIAYMKRGQKKGMIYFIGSLLFFQLGLITYESNWIAPFFVFLLSWATVKKKQKEWKTERIYPIIYTLYFLVNLVIRKIIIGQYSGVYGDKQVFSFNIKRVLYNGICLFVRSFMPPSNSSINFIFFTIVLFIVLFFYLRKIITKKVGDVLLLIFAVSFLASLIPVITLGISTHSRESERYLYLPSIFLCLFIIYSLLKLSLSSSKLYVAIMGLLVYNVFYLYINARDYAISGAIAKSYYSYFEHKKSTKNNIILASFPQQFNGLPLFRLGFKEGLLWMDNTDTSKILIPDDEEMKVLGGYTKNVIKSDYKFAFKEIKTDSTEKIELVYDSSSFSMAKFTVQ